MKRALIAAAVTALLAGAVVYRKATANPTGEKRLTPDLEARLKQHLDALDIDNLGTAQHKTASPSALAAAGLFANELQVKGYKTEADALRAAIVASAV
jgi:hypothetical protein